MRTVDLSVPPDLAAPGTDSTGIEIAAPPRQHDPPTISGSMGMILVPAASGVGAVLLAVTHQDRPLLAAAGLLVLAASIAVGLVMIIGLRTGARRRIRVDRERYLDYLEQVRVTLRATAEQQRARARARHPDPRSVWSSGRDMPWESAFRSLRIGLGAVPLVRPISLRIDADDPLTNYDPVGLAAAHEIAEKYRNVEDQPICLGLSRQAVVRISGPSGRVRDLARALIAQLVFSQPPEDVALVVFSGDRLAWNWLKWLPHCRSDHNRDGPLSARLVTDDENQLRQIIVDELGAPRPVARGVIVLIDGVASSPTIGANTLSNIAGVQQLWLLGDDRPDESADARVVLDCDGSDDYLEHSTDGTGQPLRTSFRADRLDAAGAMLLARSIASQAGERTAGGSVTDLVSGHTLRFGDAAAIDPAVSWRPQPSKDLLRVMIGTGDGAPTVLDLKESAAGGVGPHGLLVGATGSGKSELLRALVAALVMGHSPESLALLLADFKGGATFSAFAELPHIAGMITNLESDLTLVDRFRDALAGELQRRQELLAAAGKLTSLESYARLRSERPELETVPRLLVIVDEFSELLSARPDLADLFVAIGRIGRSIGIHLLLATQRLDQGRIRGLESHLSYRICLRTFSEAESREAIGSAAAYHLPTEPGWAYLRGDGPDLRKFRSAMVSRPYAAARKDGPRAPIVMPFELFNGVAARLEVLAGEPTTVVSGPVATEDGRTVLDVAIRALCTGARRSPWGAPARRIWLDPLPNRLTITEFASRARTTGNSALPRAAIGLIDLPQAQRQDPLYWDLAQDNGNLLIVGNGRSGKSTAIRTILVSLALGYSPRDVQVYVVDFGGESMLALQEVPHISAVGSRAQPELTHRIFAALTGLLGEREELFRAHRLTSISNFRDSETELPDVPAQVVLIIDDWAAVQETDPTLDAVLEDILSRGPGLGIHTVATVRTPGQLRSRLAAGFGGRIELRLSDSFDSVIDRQRAKTLAPGIPGRALVAGGHYAQLAMPVINPDGGGQATSMMKGTSAQIISAIRERWPGLAAPRLRMLPARVQLGDLPRIPDTGRGRVVLGLAQDDLGPVVHDLGGADPHLVIFGDSGAGKSSLLRTLLGQLTEWDGADQVVVVDYRRMLPVQHLAGRCLVLARSVADSAAVCAALAAELTHRMTSATQDGRIENGGGRLDRGEIYLLIDDFDLVWTATGNPLGPLIPFLPHGRDIGFHLLLARRSGGAARAQYEPLLQTLGDLGTPVVLLSAAPTEGRLMHGLVPKVLPPGRAQLARRGMPTQIIQTIWTPHPQYG